MDAPWGPGVTGRPRRRRGALCGWLAGAVLLAATGCGERVTTDAWMFDEAVERVEGDVGPASVSVNTDDIDGARVNVELRYTGMRPEVGVAVQDGTLYLALLCGDAETCDGSFGVVVPSNVSANLTTTTGRVGIADIGGVATVRSEEGVVDLDGIGGSVDLSVGSSTVDVRDVTGAVTASSHDGEIKVDQVVGRLDLESTLGLLVGTHLTSSQGVAETNSGQVFLTWDESPDQVDIESVSGDVFLTVPAGLYQIVAGSITGEVSVEGVEDDPGATRVLRVTTEFGNISIVGV